MNKLLSSKKSASQKRRRSSSFDFVKRPCAAFLFFLLSSALWATTYLYDGTSWYTTTDTEYHETLAEYSDYADASTPIQNAGSYLMLYSSDDVIVVLSGAELTDFNKTSYN